MIRRLSSGLALAFAFLFIAAPLAVSQPVRQPGRPTVAGGTCSTHQFATSVGTNGAPGCAQPAFSDISSTLDTTQCPTPTTSTIGCVKSIASASHKWIAGISNAGTPSLTQPACADLSDVAGGCNNSGATLQAQPTDPTGTSSATFLMMGLGSTCTITPTGSTRVFLEIKGVATNNSTGGVTVRARYGTGTAPANAAANTGTLVGTNQFLNTSGGIQSGSLGFVVGGVVTGLTKNTPIWIDASMEANGTGTASISGVVCTAFEM